MTGDFLTRLARRALAAEPEVQPVLAPLYAPGPGVEGALPVEVEEEVEARPVAPRRPPPVEQEVNTARLQRREEVVPSAPADVPSPASPLPAPSSPRATEEFEAPAGPPAPAPRPSVPVPQAPAARERREGPAPSRETPRDAPAPAPAGAEPASPTGVPAPAARAPEPPPPADRGAPEQPAVRPAHRAAPSPFPTAPARMAAEAPSPMAGDVSTRETGLVAPARPAPSGEPPPSAAPEPPLLEVTASVSERTRERQPRRRGQAPEEAAPVIRVTIGRVEVRAVAAPSSAPPAARPADPGLSLDEYLAQQGRRR